MTTTPYDPLTVIESAFLEFVERGLLDKHLETYKKTIDSRLLLLRKSRDVDDFEIGDTVRFNDFCGTAYLRGLTASVVGIDKSKLIVKLLVPVGRFIRVVNGITESAEIRVPPSIVDRLAV